jgi:hypothetical protein
MRLGAKLLCAVLALGCYIQGHNLGKQLVTISVPFNQILGTDTVPVQVPSAAHTLTDALPLGLQHV